MYALLRAAERAVPVSSRLTAFLREEHPDLVVVSPLVDLMSVQVDVVRASHALGIPVALPVASWDNLTNKGHLRVLPDAVMVWNDVQKEEAVALHGVADRIAEELLPPVEMAGCTARMTELLAQLGTERPA